MCSRFLGERDMRRSVEMWEECCSEVVLRRISYNVNMTRISGCRLSILERCGPISVSALTCDGVRAAETAK